MSKALLTSSATVIVGAGEGNIAKPLLRFYLVCIVPSLYGVVYCTRVAWVCSGCLLLCKEDGSSPAVFSFLY